MLCVSCELIWNFLPRGGGQVEYITYILQLTNEFEVVQVVRVDIRGRVDLKGVVVLVGVLKQAVHWVQHLQYIDGYSDYSYNCDQ